MNDPGKKLRVSKVEIGITKTRNSECTKKENLNHESTKPGKHEKTK